MKQMLLVFIIAVTPMICFESMAGGPRAVASIRNFQLSYVDTGNPQGIPIILVHAFPLNQSMWDGQVEALKKTNRVITFDIRGLGESKSSTPYTLEYVVDDLIGLLDYLKIDKAVVCGLSMGGFVALRAVERNPERFLGLILADTKSEPDSDASRLGRYKALKAIQEQGLETFSNSFIKSALAPVNQNTSSEVFKAAQKIAMANTPIGVEMAVLSLTSRTDTTPGLSEIHIPTMILQGESDTIIPLASAQALKNNIKGSSFYLIPKAGHLSNLENPQEFNSRCVQFLSGLK